MAETCDFKFRTRLGFDKAHHKITPIGKIGCGLWLEKLPKILKFPYSISVMAEASNFKIGMWLGLAKAHHNIPHQITRRPWPWARKALQNFGVPLNISAAAEASNFKFDTESCQIFGVPSPLIFLQWPCCPLSVRGAAC